MDINPTWSAILSDLFVNLSAGWFGVVLIVPNFTEKKGAEKFWILISDFAAAILCLLIAFMFKELV